MTNQTNDKTTSAALGVALHEHLQAIAKRPFDAAMLMELEQTCRLARQLSVVNKEPTAFSMGSMVAAPVNPAYEGSIGSYLTPASSNPTETFGVQAIKELVALIPGMLQPKERAREEEPPPAPLNYSELASAMAIARGAGDDKLYGQLMTRLETEQRRAELLNEKLGLKTTLALSEPKESEAA